MFHPPAFLNKDLESLCSRGNGSESSCSATKKKRRRRKKMMAMEHLIGMEKQKRR
jgi:hypothetical protein